MRIKPAPTQDELHHIFCNYWAAHEYETGDVYYLKVTHFNALRGILHYDEMEPSQWWFNEKDRDKVMERINR